MADQMVAVDGVNAYSGRILLRPHGYRVFGVAGTAAGYVGDDPTRLSLIGAVHAIAHQHSTVAAELTADQLYLSRAGYLITCARDGVAPNGPSAPASPTSHGAVQAPMRGALGSAVGILHMTGGPAPGISVKVPGEVYAYIDVSLAGTPIARVRAGAGGRFRLNLEPGTYYLAATSPKFQIEPRPGRPPCRGQQPAVITANNASRVDIICPMK